MSRARIEKLQALLQRVEQRRAAPRLQAVRTPAAAAALPTPAPLRESDSDLFAPTLPPSAPAQAARAAATTPAPAPVASQPPAADPARRAPSSPLEDAMAKLDESGPLDLGAFVAPARSETKRDAVTELAQQPHWAARDAMVTHRPGSPSVQAPPIELIQPAVKAPALREPTVEFDTGPRANPPTQRELRPAGFITDPPQEAAVVPSYRLEPTPLPADAAPARAISAARIETPKSFGELLDLSLSLRPR